MINVVWVFVGPDDQKCFLRVFLGFVDWESEKLFLGVLSKYKTFHQLPFLEFYADSEFLIKFLRIWKFDRAWKTRLKYLQFQSDIYTGYKIKQRINKTTHLVKVHRLTWSPMHQCIKVPRKVRVAVRSAMPPEKNGGLPSLIAKPTPLADGGLRAAVPHLWPQIVGVDAPERILGGQGGVTRGIMWRLALEVEVVFEREATLLEAVRSGGGAQRWVIALKKKFNYQIRCPK